MRKQKRKKQAGKLAVICLLTAAITGCQKQYEPARLPEETPAAVTLAEETENQGSGQQSGVSELQVYSESEGATSRNEVVLTTETAPKAETVRDFTAVEETVYVTGSQVNLRKEAGTQAEIITRVNYGEELLRTGYHEKWSRVMYQGQECYISSDYVSTKKPEGFQSSWKYAEFSKIHSGSAVMYRSDVADRKGITIAVNAGHGTKGGSSVKTQCHPDGTPKVTGGTTGAGATTAVAVSSGMTFADGTSEAAVTLALAYQFRDKLLAAGYDVLMLRDGDDVQLDNVARTVWANNAADCHISLHWDSTSSDKGAFYMSVPNVSSYRNMEPVKSNWEKHNALGESLVSGLRQVGVRIFSGGSMEMDLTQTSYSTIPSVDIELGDKASDHSAGTLSKLADGLVKGVDHYFGDARE